MSLKTRWLASMLGVVLAGTVITTLISSNISFYVAGRTSSAWLSATQKNVNASIHQQIFTRLEVQARLLAGQPVLVEAFSTERASELHSRMDALVKLPAGDFWAVVGGDGSVLATSLPDCHVEGAGERPPPGAAPARSFVMCGRVPAFAVTTALTASSGAQGWLVLGFLMGDGYADLFFLATGVEVMLLDREGLITSSFHDTSGKRVSPGLGAIPQEALWSAEPRIGKYVLEVPRYRGYFGVVPPHEPGDDSLPCYLLSLPLLPEQPGIPVRLVLTNARIVTEVGAVYSTVIMIAWGLLLLPLLGFVVWRLVTGFAQPISQLGKMAARVAEGDLECTVPVSRQDELGQLTRDFNDMVRKLRETQRRLMHTEKMAAVGQLAAGVGHEINNPLAYVTANLGFATEALSALPPDHLPPEVVLELREVSQVLDEAQDGARRVARIVRDLRTFAHDDKDEEKQVMEVRQVVEAALKFASNTLRYRARVTCDFQETARVEANEARLAQVFINLLVNAAQAIPEGHADENEIRVTTAMDEGGFVVVEVSDTGKGMGPEVLGHLFEPFFTTKPMGQGTGLGLSISRNIIEGLGGSLTVRSTPEKGSTFRVSLPPARQQPAESPPKPQASRAGRKSGCVLVVDDEPLVGASAKRILRSLCDVVVVTSSREALALVEAGRRFDLVLCDLMMPQMTGMELHAELSRRAPEVAARMLFLTGGAFTSDAQRFLSQRRWLQKPIDNEALRTCVSEWLR
ncbi:hybrid sensor histidine kinase/response regulator [Archangium violaceum]|uniref:hybrid sensor histidine kinase/response regulator n=1 Tax=Archangium violaceum TaxID=83451 RepID=UPI00194DEC9B|nr:ATP-binding protein [Archangium violaceum]QRO00377.1 hybrid sensor histidine kinase/response regulator [Archangium violaceum]